MGRKMTESGLRIDLMGMGYVELVADGRRPVDEHLLVLGPPLLGPERSSRDLVLAVRSWLGTLLLLRQLAVRSTLRGVPYFQMPP